MPSFAIHTLGCRLNQADSAHLADDLAAHGFRPVPWGGKADLLIIDSCAITAEAARKSIQALRAARKSFPDAYVVFAGCEANLRQDRRGLAGLADLVLPNPKPRSLFELLPDPLPGTPPAAGPAVSARPFQADGFRVEGAALPAERTRANLKIQEGCDFRCSYCIVPATRGPAASRDLDDVLREARVLAGRGCREIVLTGVNIAAYRSQGVGLPGLVERILDAAPGFRVRLGSTEPGGCLDGLVDLVAGNDRICRFLHLPVQYGETSILRKMRRRYTAEAFAGSARRAAGRIPGLCLGTDLIVGFPGETDEAFERCREFIESLPFGLMHVFVYSPRQDTPAAALPGRPPRETARRRSAAMLDLAARKTRDFARGQLGKTLPVLIERCGTEPLRYRGWSDNYLDVRFASETPLRRGQIVQVRITAAGDRRELQGIHIGDDPFPDQRRHPPMDIG